MTLAERLKTARNFFGDDQQAMASRLDIKYRTYQNYESGASEPKSAVIERLVRLGFNAHWLITGSGTMREPEARPELARDSAANLAIDEELNARIIDGISRLYKTEGIGLSDMDLGRLAARTYQDLANTYDDPDERLLGLKLAIEHLRRELRKPVDTSSKRLA